MGLWAALQFLTILPTPLRGTVSAKVSGQSLAYFPFIGLILGSILLGVWYGLAFILPPSVVYALLIIALAILTGAHHLDGLIDTFDGVMVGKDKEERLQVMADTKVGAFGIAAIILLLILKYAALSSAPVVTSLLLMPTLSRWTMVCAIFAFPYAKDVGMGLVFKQGATWQRLIAATAIPLVTAVVLLKWWGLALMSVLLLIILGIAGCFHLRIGGLTGDSYGAINELAEVLVLLLLITWERL